MSALLNKILIFTLLHASAYMCVRCAYSTGCLKIIEVTFFLFTDIVVIVMTNAGLNDFPVWFLKVPSLPYIIRLFHSWPFSV